MKYLHAFFLLSGLGIAACGTESVADSFDEQVESDEIESMLIEEVDSVEYNEIFYSDDAPQALSSYGNNVIMRMKVCTYISHCSTNSYGSVCAVKWSCPVGFRF